MLNLIEEYYFLILNNKEKKLVVDWCFLIKVIIIEDRSKINLIVIKFYNSLVNLIIIIV